MTITAPPTFRFRLRFESTADQTVYPGDWVPDPYLNFAREQAVFEAQRAGVVGPDPGAATVEMHPIFSGDRQAEIAGVRFEVIGRAAQHETVFSVTELFQACAEIQVMQLAKSNVLSQETKVVFRVVAEPDAAGLSSTPGPVAAIVRRKPLALVPGRLDDWLGGAKAHGPISDTDYPLVILENALQTARRYMFKVDKREGAALLLGHLYQQATPKPEIFGVVDSAIEMRHADQKAFSLDPTPQMYTDMNARLTRRQTRLGRSAEVPLVLGHNHPFLPSADHEGDTSCPICPRRPTCPLTTSFYSRTDVRFHASMYGKRPYVCGLVIGFTPREEETIRMFRLRGSQACERGFYTVAQRPKEN